MVRTLLLGALLITLNLTAQNKKSPIDKFRQLEDILPTPNESRTASGAPGYKYWQQRADYSIDVELDDVNQKIIGRASITSLGQAAATQFWELALFPFLTASLPSVAALLDRRPMMAWAQGTSGASSCWHNPQLDWLELTGPLICRLL